MAIVGIFTNNGIAKTIDASLDTGFHVVPTKFGVSRDAGALDGSRSTANSGMWYSELISTRVVVDNNTVKMICTIPQNSAPVTEMVREIYLFAEDRNGVEFLLALGQPTDEIRYDPSGTVTLELQISLVDIDLTANYVFENTKATELAEHLSAPDAHIEYAEAMAKSGIFVPAGAYPFDYVGQSFDEGVEFDGVKASALYSGKLFTAVKNGTELNGESIVFDGVMTLDEVVALFNSLHPMHMVSHNGTGAEVLPQGDTTLTSGVYHVEQLDLVYKDIDKVYKSALADGTIKGKFVGAAYLEEQLVRGIGGFISIQTGYTPGEDLFLSEVNAGKLTNISTSVAVGHQVDTDYIFLGAFGGSGSSGIGAGYDAVVSESLGFQKYKTLQDAINIVPNHGFILVEKLEELKSRIRTFGKTVNIVFRGYNTGLVRYTGRNDIQHIAFSAIPNRGSFRIEFRDLYSNRIQFTSDMPFNVTAPMIEAEMNLLDGHNGVVVTGDTDIGFTLTFNDFIELPLITLLDQGQNEIQRFDFSQVPDDGTADFEFENNSGENHAFNDTPDQLFQILFPLPGINDIDIRGNFDLKYYEVEFKGVDGLQNKSPLSILNSNLNVGGSGGTGGDEIEINGQLSSLGPIDAVMVKEGRFPSHNLSVGEDKIEIDVTKVQAGSEMGPSKAIELDSNNCQIVGVGRLKGFDAGIDMSAYKGTRIEMHFEDTTLPLDGKGQYIGRDFNFDGSLGIKRDAFDAKPIYEELEGEIDGVNPNFTSVYEPNTASQFVLTRDGLMMDPAWYNLVNNTISIIYSGAIPTLGQNLIAWYTPDILDFTPAITYYPWFKEHITNKQNEFKLPLSSSYNRGSDRLEMYRNGVMMNLGVNVGSPIERYQEFSETEIGLSLHAQVSDIYTAVFKDIRIISKGNIVEQSNANLLVVPAYTLGANDLKIFRNGILMNKNGKGSAVDQYTEVDDTHIGLLESSIVSDIFTFEVSEFNGTREDINNLDNTTTVTLANSIASGKILVYRNGKLIYDVAGLGSTIDRYSVTNNFEIELGEAAQLTDYITIITLGA